jgi:hypothetical protein
MKHFITAAALALVFFIAPSAHAATNPFSSITFPIADLGNCASLSDCKAYCDIADNAQVCTTWGQAHNLIPKAPPTNPTLTAINKALANNPGPGGCTTADACKTYCADTTHQAECIAFAKAHKLIRKEDQQKVDANDKLDALIAAGGPGGCTTRDACKTYCADTTHQAECKAFAMKAGLMMRGDDGHMGSSTPGMMGDDRKMPPGLRPCKGEDCMHGSSTMPGRPPMMRGEGDDHPPFPGGPNGVATSTLPTGGRPPFPPGFMPHKGGDAQQGGPQSYNDGERGFSTMGASAAEAFHRGLDWLFFQD